MSSSLALLHAHRPEDLVAFGGAGDRTAADLRADAARVADALPEPREDSHVLLVFERDRYAMAAALLGVLERGHAVALPPSTRRDAILGVRARPETLAVVHDTEAGLPFDVFALIGREAPGATASCVSFVPREGVIATVYTSGTTGSMTPWRKTSAQLLGEAHALARNFGIGPGDRIVGTVPPGHIYGLLFTVLLPLACGAAFSRETPVHAESVARCVGEQGARVLITVPAQLRALASLPRHSLASLGRVFSSTGPLPEAVARAFHARHERPITEVLGSTETGGIASRIHAGAVERWRPFPEVVVAEGEGGTLRVDSPFVDDDLPRPFPTADLVRLHDDGSFSHLGRSDGVVKIGGRRVSIQEMEECLRQQAGVEDVAVAAVEVDGGRGQQLLAAVAPASCAVAELRKALLKRFEPTCVPRRIHCVETLPRESNGKLPRDRLLRLFGLRADGTPFNWALEWGESEVVRDGRVDRRVRIPEDYSWFDGHFEGYPVLAGAVQIKELILPTIEHAFPGLGPLVGMSRVKFAGRIVPGDELTVRVTRGGGPGVGDSAKIGFEIRRGMEICSAGLALLGTGPDENDAGVGEVPARAVAGARRARGRTA